MSRHGIFGFMQDEEGNLSMARLMLVVWTAFTLVAVWLSAIDRISLPDPAYPLLGSTLLAIVGWAAGPRIMKHIGGQIAGVASGISQSLGIGGRGTVTMTVSDLPQAKTPEEE